MAEKRFVNAFVKMVDTKYGGIINVNIERDDFNELPVDAGGYVKLSIMKRKEVSDTGATHYVVHNDYKKPWDGDGSVPVSNDDDLPF